MRGLFIFVFAISLMSHSYAQKEDSIKISQNLFNIKELSIYDGKITPFIAPSYTPETELLFSGGFLLTYKVQRDNKLLARSTLPVSASYSTNNSFFFSVKPFIYGPNDKHRISGELWIKDMPDHYWGVGYEAGRNTVKSDSTTLYQRNWFRFFPKISFKVKKHFYIGGAMDINRTEISDPNAKMLTDPAYLEFGELIRNSGLGITANYDSRDLAVNAYKGTFLSTDILYYGNYLGGAEEFWIVEFDYRQYRRIHETKRRIIAWNIKNRNGIGNVPWTELPQLGTPFDLRGYAWGRYRDQSMLYGLLEYRAMFQRKKPNNKGSYQSRSGFVLWGGLGSVAPKFGHYKNWLPNLGVGFRFEVEERMNLRIDYGRGLESDGFYVSFTEAF